jgi:hypothetical protein
LWVLQEFAVVISCKNIILTFLFQYSVLYTGVTIKDFTINGKKMHRIQKKARSVYTFGRIKEVRAVVRKSRKLLEYMKMIR